MGTLSLPKTRRNGSKTMNGHYQSNALQQQVADWIRFTLQTKHDPPLSRPLTIHLNALLDRSVDRESLVAVSFQTFRVLIEQLDAMVIPDTIMPTLCIPLECSETLIAGPLEAETLLQQINYNEPPTLYLTERSLQTKLIAIEKYVFPLQAENFMENSSDIYVYYNSIRTLEDIKNGWEYGRIIRADYYPAAYQILP